MTKGAPKLQIGLILTGSRQWAGGIEYTRNLIAALNAQPSNVRDTFQIHLFIRGDVDTSLSDQFRPEVDFVHQSSHSKVLFFYQLLKGKINFLFPYQRHLRWLPSFSGAAWIPDFQHEYLPEYFSSADLLSRRAINAGISKFSQLVVFSSRMAAQDFQRLYPHLRSNTEVMNFRTRIKREWLNISPIEAQKKYNLPDRFLIVCNQFWAHKNHMLILDALVQLRSEGVFPVLVMTGHPYDNRKFGFIDKILGHIHQNNLHPQIHMLGMIERIDQLQLIRRSMGVIHPSRFEGWSTVVEDARSLGKNIFLSDIPVHLEQNPPNAKFFGVDSTNDLANILKAAWISLAAGPDQASESAGILQNEVEVLQFGARFLQIIQTHKQKAPNILRRFF